MVHVLTFLNNFYTDIEFTYEAKENGKITFLDILIIRNNKTLKATVYRKKTQRSLFTMEIYEAADLGNSTLCSIITRAYRIC